MFAWGAANCPGEPTDKSLTVYLPFDNVGEVQIVRHAQRLAPADVRRLGQRTMHLSGGNFQDEPAGDAGVELVKAVLDGILLGDDEVRRRPGRARVTNWSVSLCVDVQPYDGRRDGHAL